MTEADWLDSADPGPMLRFLREQPGHERKLRLFAVACCRRLAPLVADPDRRRAVEVIERYADGRASDRELGSARLALVAARADRNVGMAPYWASKTAIADVIDNVRNGTVESLAHAAVGRARVARTGQADAWETAFAAGARAQADLLRDLFGNPFRPAAVRPAWLASADRTVLRLARAIYDEQAFDRLGILADALEEAGCTDAAFLGHCRRPAEHVRGCWVLDALLAAADRHRP
jgi:hypothetical protein